MARRFETIAEADEAQEALVFLAEDFASPSHLGPMRRRNESLHMAGRRMFGVWAAALKATQQ